MVLVYQAEVEVFPVDEVLVALRHFDEFEHVSPDFQQVVFLVVVDFQVPEDYSDLGLLVIFVKLDHADVEQLLDVGTVEVLED